MSQMDLALEAEISTRHLSFVETGRSTPSRDLVLRLSEQLDLPLRERNDLLLAAGFAPVYPLRGLDDAELAPALDMIRSLLRAHEPFPALAFDRHWNLVARNRALEPLLGRAADWLLVPPINVLRLTLHPEGLAPAIVNLPQWRAHLMHRLRRQFMQNHEDGLAALLREFEPLEPDSREGETHAHIDGLAVPLRFQVGGHVLSFVSTTMVFGGPLDVTLSELAIETFLPADDITRSMLVELHGMTGAFPT